MAWKVKSWNPKNISDSLLNSLPRNIRDLKGCSVEALKNELDKFLLKLPDAPLIPGYTASSLVGSNSVVVWCNWLKCVASMSDEGVGYSLVMYEGTLKYTIKNALNWF